MNRVAIPMRGLGSGASSSWTPNYTPLWSEQAYVPGAVNPDPSVNTNPNPTIASTVQDIGMVLTDPMARNPFYNATDTASTSLGDTTTGIPAWVLTIPAVLLALWVIGKVL